jgi:hypothetical protein
MWLWPQASRVHVDLLSNFFGARSSVKLSQMHRHMLCSYSGDAEAKTALQKGSDCDAVRKILIQFWLCVVVAPCCCFTWTIIDCHHADLL